MRTWSIPLAALLCGAIAVSTIAARTSAPAAKTQSSPKAMAEKEERDLHERSQKRERPSDVKQRAKHPKHDISSKFEKEDDDDE